MYTRFEVYKDSYKRGLLTCLDEIGLSIDIIEELSEHFDKYLKVPNFYYEKGKKAKRDVFAYFTDKGLEFFKEDIEVICNIAKEKGYEISIIKQDKVGSARLVYEDKFQALIRRK